MLWIIIGLVFSYLLGCIPTAYLFVRMIKGLDIRKFGSGNVGATNALRLLGKKAGIAILILDILKGIIPVVYIANFILFKVTVLSPEMTRIILGLAAVIGHSWTIFLNFKGGKGVATTFGTLIGLAIKIPGFPYVFFGSVLVWLVCFLLTRIVSLASICTAVAFPLFMFLFRQPKGLIIITVFLSLFIILRHKSNIQRILQGKEPRLIFKKTI